MKCLTELPIRWCHVVTSEGSSITSGDLERERLTIEIRISLPILAPISGHGMPCRGGAFNGDCMNIPCTSHVGDQNQVEVRVTINGEPYSSLSHTRHSVIISHKNILVKRGTLCNMYIYVYIFIYNREILRA